MNIVSAIRTMVFWFTASLIVVSAAAADESNDVVKDPSNSLIWQLAPISDIEFSRAEAHCRDLELASYSDWRLPTDDELVSGFLTVPPEPGYADGKTFILWSSTLTEQGNVIVVFRNQTTEAGSLERERDWKPGGATIGARCVHDE